MAGDVIGFRDVLCTEGGVQKVVTARIRAGWKRFKNVAGILHKKGFLQ